MILDLFSNKERKKRLKTMSSQKAPLVVCVTGAAGQIAYSLLYQLAKGDVFGRDQPMVVRLLDIPQMVGALEGVVMELQDCSLPLLKEVVATADVKEAFTDCDYAALVGAMPRREGMERKDLLAANVNIFKAQGKALEQFAKKTVKVLVVGNPANTNAFICARYAPTIPSKNFSALTRLDQNRCTAQVAMKLGVGVTDVHNCIIWGNHSSTQFPDVAHATVDYMGKTVSAADALKDDHWIKQVMVPCVQKRGAAVIAARKLSSAMSAAKGICDHLHDWHFGLPDGQMVSMAVPSDGSYGIPTGIVYSFPVRIGSDGSYSIVNDLPISDYARDLMDKTLKELAEERDAAIEVCTD